MELLLQEPLSAAPFERSRVLGAMILVDTASHKTAGAVLVRGPPGNLRAPVGARARRQPWGLASPSLVAPPGWSTQRVNTSTGSRGVQKALTRADSSA